MDGFWNPLSETLIKEDSKLRKHANEILTTHEFLHLITEALKPGTKFSSKTSISKVKRYLEGLSSFAENTRNRLEFPALTAVQEAVLNFQIRWHGPCTRHQRTLGFPYRSRRKAHFHRTILKKGRLPCVTVFQRI